MANHQERARARREAELYALQTAIEAHKLKYARYPSDKQLAEMLKWPVWKIKYWMAYLTSQGLGRRAYLVPSQRPIEYDTLASDIQRLKQAGVEPSTIAEWCAIAIFGGVVD